MEPQYLLRLEKLERDLEKIKNVTDTAFVAELTRRLSGIQIRIEDGASTTGTSVSVRNAADTGSETVAEQYTSVANLYLNGTLVGRIGIY